MAGFVVTGLCLSRRTVLCTPHAHSCSQPGSSFCISVQERYFLFAHLPPRCTSMSLDLELAKILDEFAVPEAFRTKLLDSACLKVWQFAAFVDVVLVSSNWIDLELKNSHSASSCSPGSRGQRPSFNLLPTHCGYFHLLVFPIVQRTASIIQFASHALWVFPPPRAPQGPEDSVYHSIASHRTVGSAPHPGCLR